jgi:hypothetical protein
MKSHCRAESNRAYSFSPQRKAGCDGPGPSHKRRTEIKEDSARAGPGPSQDSSQDLRKLLGEVRQVGTLRFCSAALLNLGQRMGDRVRRSFFTVNFAAPGKRERVDDQGQVISFLEFDYEIALFAVVNRTLILLKIELML